MSAKDKDNPLSKLKQFFRSSKVPGSNIKERDLWPELEKELSREIPDIQRCKTLKDLGDFVLTTKLENASVIKLWELTKDLIIDNKSMEHRHIALTFYKKLIQGQYTNLSMMREHFFNVIQKHEVPEDLKYRLELLITLTDNGKDITCFEEKIGKFMLNWEPAIVEAGLTEPYLEMLMNIIKFNVAHLDNDIVVEIVRHACHLSCSIDDKDIGLQCLRILDTVICYAIFPNETLTLCVGTLCRTVNILHYCQTSWKIMKNLLGTTLGHASLLIMCQILNDKNFYNDEILLRGAISHINLSLWGSTNPILPMLKYSTSKVLMSFLNVLTSQKIIVTYEIILSLQMMIPKYGKELPEHIWDVICDILNAIVNNIAFYESNGLPKDFQLQQQFHEIIDIIEDMLQKDEICANTVRIYDLIETIADNRPEISVLNLIEYRTMKIIATGPQWLQQLNKLIQRFYNIPNRKIRIKLIESIVQIMDANRSIYEEEILAGVVIPQFSLISYETDLHIRTAVGEALIKFTLHCDTKRCIELLDILEKILNRPFELYTKDGFIFSIENDIQDIYKIIEGLIDVFMVKLYHLPSCHAIRIYDILIGHLEQHYKQPNVFQSFNEIRNMIFIWMLKARANKTYRIGYPDPANSGMIRFSHYLGIDTTPKASYQQQQQQQQQSERYQYQISQFDTIPTLNFTKISIRKACKTIITCLQSEKDFSVFKLVLKELPHILQNKALIKGNNIDTLANTLFKIFFNRKFVDSMVPPSMKLTSDDFNALILPAIANLIIYHQYLPSNRQQLIIEALKIGIPSKIAPICINTLTIMIIEMPEILMRKLPEVLLEMSKMSSTIAVAIPVLEFLSILSRLPNSLFTNFVPKQYMYVFAITLPYTKPHPYNHYTVSLAYHVIAGWFLKCKLAFRKNFVNYIITSIQSNAQLSLPNDFINEDSSNRKRSSSLTEHGSRGRDRPNPNLQPLMNESLKNFHAELAETCIDFIVRHTFSPCSALPKRLPAADYLLKGGPSQTWLVGHNLITITTSACSSPTRNGLCERCASLSSTSLEVDSGGPTISTESAGLGTRIASDLKSSSSLAKRRFSASSSSSIDTFSRRASVPVSTSTVNHDGLNITLLENTLNQVHPPATPPSPAPAAATTTAKATASNLVQQQICTRSCTAWAEIFIRCPTGSISWLMRIQNPIINDCLGNDMSINDLISLFLPTQYGGTFGPDFMSNDNDSDNDSISPLQPTSTTSTFPPQQQPSSSPPPPPPPRPPSSSPPSSSSSSISLIQESIILSGNQIQKKILKRQEEITSLSTCASGPIVIPKKDIKYKEFSGSFSDVDPNNDDDDDDDDITYETGDSKCRNPVRRVSSSPEMSSTWRSTFITNKTVGKLSNTNNIVEITATLMIPKDKDIEIEQQHQKKKTFPKDMRVSCEAIPEEIGGSTSPSLHESLKDEDETKQELNKEEILPLKQHSADEIIQQTTTTGNSKISIDFQKATKKLSSQSQSGTGGAPLSPRSLVRNVSIAGADSLNDNNNNNNSNNNRSNDIIRERSKTISVVREVNRDAQTSTTFRHRTSNPPTNSRFGINPSFIFLQLFYTGQLPIVNELPPIKVGPDAMTAINLLDLIPPFETHKIGVLYVGPGQCNNETEILKNRYGSVRYVEFLRNLGTLVSLKDAKENNLFINMEHGRDGNFTYIWKDDIVHVTFHVATLMPNLESDPNCTEKKKHIGNDYVSIVYNESGEEYNLNTLKGQFNYACVVVEPLELKSNRIFVRAKNEIANFICHTEGKIVSDSSAPILARQLALHANLASHVSRSLKTKTPYASNWLERLRKIKNLKAKLLKDSQARNIGGSGSGGGAPSDQYTLGSVGDVSGIHRPNIYDFTKYT